MRTQLHMVMQAVISICAALALGVGEGNAQPDSLWASTLGAGYIENCNAAIITRDNRFVLVGEHRNVRGYHYMQTICTDSSGEILWRQRCAITDRFGLIQDYLFGVTELTDGRIAACGFDMQGSPDALVLILNAGGDSLNTVIMHDEYSKRLIDIAATSDGGFIACGSIESDGWAVKCDSSGEQEWELRVNGGSTDALQAVDILDDGYAFCGRTGNGSLDYWLVKCNLDGEFLWSETYGGRYLEECDDLVKSADGGFALSGYSTRDDENGDFWLVKTDSLGRYQWDRTYGGEADEVAYSIKPLPDGGFVLAGPSESFRNAPPSSNGDEFYIVRVNSSGDLLWQGVYGGRYDEDCHEVLFLPDSGFALAGSTSSFSDAGDGADMRLVRLGPDPVLFDTTSVPFEGSPPTILSFNSPYPNPFNSSTTISFSLNNPALVQLTVYGFDGRLVKELWTGGDAYPTGTHQVVWNGSALPAGEYLIRLEAGDAVKGTKAVVIK